MLLVGVGASAAAGAALLLPLVLYYHFVDRRKSNSLAAVTFCCTLTLALLLALLVPLDILHASRAASRAAQETQGGPPASPEPQGPSVTEAAAAAHASNVSSAFTPPGAAAAAAAAAGWAALSSASLPLTPELLQRTYCVLGLAVFLCCCLLTPAAIFYSSELSRRQSRDLDEYDSLPCETCASTLKRTGYFVFGLAAVLLLLLALRPGMPAPSFLRPEVAAEPQGGQRQQQPLLPTHADASAAGLMAAAAAAASAAAATASAAAARAAAAARRVDSEAVQLYTAQLLGVQETGVDSLLYLGTCFLCAAQLVWTCFGASGLATLSLKWLLRGPSTQQKQQEVQQEIATLREQQRRIQCKYTGQLDAMRPKDREALERLRVQQRLWTERNYKLQEAEQGPLSAYSVLHRVLLPFRKAVGLALLLLLLLLLVSLGTVLVRRLNNSNCGWSCGFAASADEGPPTLADTVLLMLSSYPPTDLWLVCCWLLLLLFGGLYGLLSVLPRLCSARNGHSELQAHVRSVRGGGSSPQVLLLISALLALHTLAAGLCIFTVAPQYASFGKQTFTPLNGSDAMVCSLHAAAAGSACRPTVFAAALSRVAFASPALASFLYCSNWVFLIVSVCCLIYFAFFRWRAPPKSREVQHRSAAEDLEDMAAVDESAGLLGV